MSEIELNPFIEAAAVDLTSTRRHGEQYVFRFRNEYGASVVRDPGFSYGGDEGLWEIAVLLDGDICYSTPITDDVLGRLSIADVRETLLAIAELPR